MNGKNIEIRWHGRGGQGAKTAALLLADVCFKTGAYVFAVHVFSLAWRYLQP